MRRVMIGALVGLLMIGGCVLLFMFVFPEVKEDNSRAMALRIEEAIRQDCGIAGVRVDPNSFDELALWTTVYEPEGKNSIYIQCILSSVEDQNWECKCK